MEQLRPVYEGKETWNLVPTPGSGDSWMKPFFLNLPFPSTEPLDPEVRIGEVLSVANTPWLEWKKCNHPLDETYHNDCPNCCELRAMAEDPNHVWTKVGPVTNCDGMTQQRAGLLDGPHISNALPGTGVAKITLVSIERAMTSLAKLLGLLPKFENGQHPSDFKPAPWPEPPTEKTK